MQMIRFTFTLFYMSVVARHALRNACFAFVCVRIKCAVRHCCLLSAPHNARVAFAVY